MNIKIKRFSELTTIELYEILKVRSEIFVVEQNCVYQDLDDLDKKCIHIWIEEENQVQAYLRYFEKKKDIVQIGRVLTKIHGKNLGRKLVEKAIEEIKKNSTTKKIYIEAQTYALGFYHKFGFQEYGKEFLEDNIPHKKMELDLTK